MCADNLSRTMVAEADGDKPVHGFFDKLLIAALELLPLDIEFREDQVDLILLR